MRLIFQIPVAIIVIEGNIVKNKMIATSVPVEKEVILKLNILLNTYLQGLDLSEINLDVIQQIKMQSDGFGSIVSDILDAIAQAISEEDKRIYREELFPYWEKRSMKDFINGQMTDEVKAATSTQIFSINQTDKGQGHIIIDYPRLLNHGLGELVAQMQQHCQQQPSELQQQNRRLSMYRRPQGPLLQGRILQHPRTYGSLSAQRYG